MLRLIVDHRVDVAFLGGPVDIGTDFGIHAPCPPALAKRQVGANLTAQERVVRYGHIISVAGGHATGSAAFRTDKEGIEALAPTLELEGFVDGHNPQAIQVGEVRAQFAFRAPLAVGMQDQLIGLAPRIEPAVEFELFIVDL